MSEEAKRFRIDPNVRLGDILVLATIIGGALSGYYSLKDIGERNTRDLAAFVVTQDRRDQMQDAAMVDFKGTVRESIVQIRADVGETRQDVKDLSRYVRGSKGM